MQVQQQTQQQRQTSSFAWPSLQLRGAAQQSPPVQPPSLQQPAPSASVNFSMPAISDLASPWQPMACRDDASSVPAGQATVPAPCPQADSRAGGAGWLQGLLAEAEYPLGPSGGSQASQQPLGGLLGRPPLAERRQQQQAQASPLGQATKRARQQQSLPQQLLVAGGAGMVFGGVDDLDLGDE